MFEVGMSMYFPTGPRNPDQVWMAVSYEAAGSAPFFFLSHPGAMSVYNYSSHFAPYADVSTQPLMDASTEAVDVASRRGIVFIASNCESHSGRDEYTEALMHHMHVTSYGACLHNQDWPKTVCRVTDLATKTSRLWANGCPEKHPLASSSSSSSSSSAERSYEEIDLESERDSEDYQQGKKMVMQNFSFSVVISNSICDGALKR